MKQTLLIENEKDFREACKHANKTDAPLCQIRVDNTRLEFSARFLKVKKVKSYSDLLSRFGLQITKAKREAMMRMIREEAERPL